MTRETVDQDQAASQDDIGVKRRGLLRFGTLVTALTGASVVSAAGAPHAQASLGSEISPNTYVATMEKGSPSGVASLDENGKILPAQLPDLSATIATATAGTLGRPALGKFRAAAAKRTTEPVAVVAVGSSTTAGGNTTNPALRYVNRLAAILQSEYPSGAGAESTPVILDGTFTTPISTRGLHFYNAGIPGARSDVYVSPTLAKQVGQIGPAMVLHMVGSNDWTAGYEPSDTKANVLAAIARIDAACATPPVHLLINQYLRCDCVGPKPWSAYGAALKEIGLSTPDRFWYVDLNPTYEALDIPGADPLKLIDSDRTHQNDSGHALMADLLRTEFGIPGQISVATAYVSTLDVLKRTAAPAYVRDTFTRADGALGNADSGQLWDAPGFTITGNKAQCTTGGNAFLTATHQNIDLSISVVVDGSSVAPGVLFRSFDGGNRMGVFIDKAQSVFLSINKNNVATNIAGGWKPVAGTHTLRVIARGNQINAYLNGRLALAHTLPQADLDYFANATKLGFRCGVGSTGVSFDNLAVRALT